MKWYCEVCGDDKSLEYHHAKRQTLCPSCAEDTPPKIGFASFCRKYFQDAEGEAVPHSIKRDFYEDYLRSSHTFKEYVEVTTEQAA